MFSAQRKSPRLLSLHAPPTRGSSARAVAQSVAADAPSSCRPGIRPASNSAAAPYRAALFGAGASADAIAHRSVSNPPLTAAFTDDNITRWFASHDGHTPWLPSSPMSTSKHASVASRSHAKPSSPRKTATKSKSSTARQERKQKIEALSCSCIQVIAMPSPLSSPGRSTIYSRSPHSPAPQT